MTEKFALTIDDYERQLDETIRILKDAAENYDKGDFYHAKTMASNIAKLIDDRGKNYPS